MNGTTSIEPHPEQMSPDDLQQWVVRRLQEGHGPFFLGGDRADERPEDILVEMLEDRTLPRERRAAIVNALKIFGVRIIESLGSETKTDFSSLDRWANVIDRTAPEELEPVVKAALTCGIEEDLRSKEDVVPLARAALRYRTREEDAVLWRALLRKEETCAFAFTALLTIKGASFDLARDLLDIWSRKIHGGWKVNADLLTASFLRKDQAGKLKIAFAHHGCFEPIRETMKHSRIARVRRFADSVPKPYQSYVTPREIISEKNSLVDLLGLSEKSDYGFRGKCSEYISDHDIFKNPVQNVISFPRSYRKPENWPLLTYGTYG